MKFIDLETQYNLIREEVKTGIDRVLESGQYIMGTDILDLETQLSDFANVKHTITCSSGTDALLMALMALGVKSGDLVATTPFTYIATAEVISLIGAIPMFIDIDPDTFNMNINSLEKQLIKSDQSIKYVMPVNIFGAPLDYNHLYQLKEKYNFKIIEDAAQSFGAKYHKKVSGNLGDIGCTSFYPAKPLGCYGDGGAVFTNDDDIADILKSIRVHGSGEDKYNNVRLGINGRMDTIQAAILIPKLKIFTDELNRRENIANKYTKILKNNFKTQGLLDGTKSSWAQFSILCENAQHRGEVMNKLKDKDIPSVIYYAVPLHLQKVFCDLPNTCDRLPVVEDICSKVVSLPMNPYLSDEDIEKVCEILLES